MKGKKKKKVRPGSGDIKIQDVIRVIEKKYGSGSLFYGGGTLVRKVDVISTGSLGLDKALGAGGYPKGRLIEIFGPESSGKTTLALHFVAMAQRNKIPVAFIDVEHALDIGYAKNLGVNINKILISQPDSAEQSFGIAKELLVSGKIGIIVFDSIAGLATEAEITGEVGDRHMAPVARFMSQNLKSFVTLAGKTNTALIFINQIRMKIGVAFGNPETTPGGNALKFFSSIRLDIRSIGKIKVGNEIIGNRTRVKVVKNKVASPFKETEFEIRFGEGIDFVTEVIDVAESLGIIVRSGAWYNYGDVRLGNGKESTRARLLDSADLYKEIYNQCRENLFEEV